MTPAPPRDLREPGAVLLVSCYELGHRPLGVAAPLAFLRRAGFDPAVIDLAVERLDRSTVQRAGLIAISVPMHTALRLGVEAARRMRALAPSAQLCFHGLYASLNADYLLREICDAVIGGEIEEALTAWAEHLSGSRPGPVSGVRLRDREAPPVLARLDFGTPEETAIPSPQPYARLLRDGEFVLAGAVEASRGCLHLCRHCPIPPVYGGRFFVVPKETVLAEIRGQAAAGAGHITFADPDFLNGPGHSLAIVRAMHRESPALTFDFTAKIEHVLEHRALLPEFAACGCAFAISAVESLSDHVLARLRKGHTRRDVHEALEILRGAGIPLRPSWLPFTPWSAVEDLVEIIEFVEAGRLIEQVDPVQYTIRLLIPPGSLLLEEPALVPHLEPLEEASFSYPWTHPDPRMDRLQITLSREVERATRAGEDAPAVFERVRRIVFSAAGIEAEAHAAGRAAGAPAAVSGIAGRPAPRLTEPWFC